VVSRIGGTCLGGENVKFCGPPFRLLLVRESPGNRREGTEQTSMTRGVWFFRLSYGAGRERLAWSEE
jgi:hypothetical protein